jgi:hypothetical protein
MNRNLFSHFRRASHSAAPSGRSGGRSISRATRTGLLIGGALVLTTGALPTMASTAKTPTSATSAAAPVKPPQHTKVKPVNGAKPPARAATRQAPRLALPTTPASASLPDSTCSLVGTTRHCDLYAMRGTITVPGMASPMPIWGFSLNSAGPATLPGPTLVALEGESLQVTLHNSLPAGAGNLALEIPESTAIPDLGGVASGGATPYSFSGLAPGSYIYEAGATANGQRQVAMGLAGMLVIRPKNWSATCHSAYDESVAGACDGTQFTAESPVEVSELSTAFNTATDTSPTSSDLHNYTPDVFLVNGQSFNSASPLTGSIPVNAGDMLFLRYANLGLRDYSISIGSGVSDPLTLARTGGQREMASDANLLKVWDDRAAMYLNPVQTADTLTQVDPGLSPGTLVPLYDQGHHLNYWAANGKPTEGGGIGGMLAMLDVVAGPTGVPAGPKTVVTVAPKVNDVNPNNPADTMTVSATITSTTNSPVSRAEWFFDNVGASGTGTAIASTCAPNFCFSIDPTTLQTLLASASSRNGQHVIWVAGMDANGWGVAAGDTFSVDLSGPLVSSTTVHSTPTNGSRANNLDGSTDLDIVGTASAALSGWVITAAEVCVDAPCQTALQPNPTYDQPGALYGSFTTSFSLNLVSAGTGTGTNDPAAPIVGFNGAIPFASLAPIADGSHTFYVHACEAPTLPVDPALVTAANCGRWGDTSDTVVPAHFTIDTVAPTTIVKAVGPDPNNGFESALGNVADLNQVRVDATISDAGTGGSAIALGEVFISQPGVLPWCYTGPTTPPLATCPSSPPAGFFGSGAEMVPTGGAWNRTDANGVGLDQPASAFIPLTDIRSFPEGKVWFWVHGEDQAGNWGGFSIVNGLPSPGYVLTLDKTPPVIDSATATTSGATTTVSVTTHDPVAGGVNANVAQVEYFIGPCKPQSTAACMHDPGPGNGTQFNIPAGTGTSGTFTIIIPTPKHNTTLFVRVRDAAGNWSGVDLTAKDLTESNEAGPGDLTTETPQTEEYGPVAGF